jgi:hypothetical protein
VLSLLLLLVSLTWSQIEQPGVSENNLDEFSRPILAHLTLDDFLVLDLGVLGEIESSALLFEVVQLLDDSRVSLSEG